MQLEKFKAQVSKQGLAKANRWEFKIFPPSGLTSSGRAISNSLSKGGNRININLPGLDALDNAIGAISETEIDLGPVSIGLNRSLPTLGYVLTNVGDKLESISMFTESCSIPGRDLENMEFRYHGEKRSLGVRHTHEGVQVSFYCSEDLRERLFFEQWQDLIFNPVNKKHAFYKDYIGEIDIFKYDTSWKNVTAGYRLKEAYPTNISSQELSTGDGELLKIQVTFNYRFYEKTA